LLNPQKKSPLVEKIPKHIFIMVLLD
jgi:hypothetical protein